MVLDRDALYYPYIHIRDANWLKATLLSFPQVRRIVPDAYDLTDRPDVLPFVDVIGARGEPLLAVEPAYGPAAEQAQQRLLKRLGDAAPDVLAGFTCAATAKAFANLQAFQLHAGKMGPLLGFLEARQLAWPARAMYGNSADWYALHPRLGELVMSVVAAAIAKEKQLDIVTSSGHVHHALAHLDENALIASLFDEPAAVVPADAPLAEMADELCQVVMLTTFDLAQLSAQQIGVLQREGKDLRSFKAEIAKLAATIPDIADPAERQKRLTAAAREVVAAWDKHQRALPRFALDALVAVSKWKVPEVLAASLAGATSAIPLAASAGLIIGLGVYAGVDAWRGYKDKAGSPYQYLSKIQKAGAVLAPKPVLAAR